MNSKFDAILQPVVIRGRCSYVAYSSPFCLAHSLQKRRARERRHAVSFTKMPVTRALGENVAKFMGPGTMGDVDHLQNTRQTTHI